LFLHDFSYAGYHNSEEPLPQTMSGLAVDVTNKGADASGQTDSTESIQAAIDEVATAGGGVVRFPAGEYRVDGHLSVTTSGLVLQGVSADQSRVYFTNTGEGITNVGSIRYRGVIGTEQETPLVADADSRATLIEVADTSGFEVGDDVVVGWIVTNEFLVEHDMEVHWQHSLDLFKPFFRREIVAIHPDGKVEIDVPLRYPTLMRDSASMRKEVGYLKEVGIENLGLSNAAPDVATATAVDHTKLIHFRGVKDAWVRGVRSYRSPVAGGDCAATESEDRSCHIQSVGLEIEQSKRFTVRDVVMQRAQSREERGNGYLFLVRYSAEVLIEDSIAAHGRHNFITSGDFSTTGCVFRNNRSSGNWCVNDTFETPCFDEYHNRFAIGNLVENHEALSGWLAGNRRDLSTGAGHVATESVFWRVHGGGELYSFQYGRGYVIGADANVQTDLINVLYYYTGHTGVGTSPEDWSEYTGQRTQVHPASLFDDQLARRLRANASL